MLIIKMKRMLLTSAPTFSEKKAERTWRARNIKQPSASLQVV